MDLAAEFEFGQATDTARQQPGQIGERLIVDVASVTACSTSKLKFRFL